MPVEIISLISSSEAGSPPPQVSRGPSPPARALPSATFDSDNYSSPTLFPARNRNTNTSSSNVKANAPTLTDDAWFISDDDFTPSGHENQLIRSPVEPAKKRRRLDSFGGNISRPYREPAAAKPPLTSSRSEPLQLSNDKRLNSTTGRRPCATLPQIRAEPPKARDWSVDNPFITSSPHPTEIPPPECGSQRSAPSISLNDDFFAASGTLLGKPKHAKPATRFILDDIDLFVSSSPAPTPRPAKSTPTAVSWDPISSSAPLPATADDEPSRLPHSFRRVQSEVIKLDDSDDDRAPQQDSDDEFPDVPNLGKVKHAVTSLSTRLSVSTSSKPPRKPKSAGTKSASSEPKKSSEEKTREREAKSAAREAEKERKRREKERAKEEKAQEKARIAALAEVNKIRTDKKVSTPEMIVDLPATLDNPVKLQAETLLRDLEVQSTSWASPVDNVVKWRRKVCSRYNDNLGHWEPIPERIDRENYAMVIIPASQFVDLVLGEGTASLESHVLRMRRHFPSDTIIYLIEGLDLWLRKNRNIRNRHFVSAVRNGLDPASTSSKEPSSSSQPTAARRRKNTPAQTYIDEEAIESSLLQLQIMHSVLIHHTTIPLETARWIAVFTQHISTVPYRRQRDEANDAGFCMETGQVRTGDGPHDTYVRMLQEIGRVTAPIAYGIAAEFGTVSKLVRGLEEGGPLRLEKVRKSVNKEGEASDRTVGQAVSRRVWKIFLGRDEARTDI
ncbi:hypothetical protein VTI74DRAFT_10007 [Chaetomium olivicolor]